MQATPLADLELQPKRRHANQVAMPFDRFELLRCRRAEIGDVRLIGALVHAANPLNSGTQKGTAPPAAKPIHPLQRLDQMMAQEHGKLLRACVVSDQIEVTRCDREAALPPSHQLSR